MDTTRAADAKERPAGSKHVHVCDQNCFHRRAASQPFEFKPKKPRKSNKRPPRKKTGKKKKSPVGHTLCKAKTNKDSHQSRVDAKATEPVRVIRYPFMKSELLVATIVFFDYCAALFGEEITLKRRIVAHQCADEERPRLRFKISSKVWEYNCVVNALTRSGFQRTPKFRYANIIWSNFFTTEQYEKLGPFQKANHFPGSYGLGRKDNLVRNIMRLKRHHGSGAREAFNFVPETFLLPNEYPLLERRAAGLLDQIWIVKPANMSCGKGIELVTKVSDINEDKPAVVSKYIMNPMLIMKRKFDMRIYVLVTCYNPLRVYLFDDGLVRFATKNYTTKSKSIKLRYIHLTNYSVNKHSKNFVKNTGAAEDGIGSKWSIRALRQYFARQGIDHQKIWSDIEGVVIKTLISIEPDVINRQKAQRNTRNNFFEVMGFDILLDSTGKPWLLEVNTSPSLSSSSPLDKQIKTKLMTDALHLCGIPAVDGRKVCEQERPRGRKLGDLLGDTAPVASEIQKFRSADGELHSAKLTSHDLQIIQETFAEQQRRGNFKVLYPTLENCNKYSTLFYSPRYNNILIYRWLQSSKKDSVTLPECPPSADIKIFKETCSGTTPLSATQSPRLQSLRESSSNFLLMQANNRTRRNMKTSSVENKHSAQGPRLQPQREFSSVSMQSINSPTQRNVRAYSVGNNPSSKSHLNQRKQTSLHPARREVRKAFLPVKTEAEKKDGECKLQSYSEFPISPSRKILSNSKKACQTGRVQKVFVGMLHRLGNISKLSSNFATSTNGSTNRPPLPTSAHFPLPRKSARCEKEIFSRAKSR